MRSAVSASALRCTRSAVARSRFRSTVTVFVEGEEESGSPTLRALLTAHREALAADGHWDMLAKAALGDELRELQTQVVLEVLHRGQGDVPQRLQAWEDENPQALQEAHRLLAELGDAKSADLAMLSVALRKLRQLV